MSVILCNPIPGNPWLSCNKTQNNNYNFTLLNRFCFYQSIIQMVLPRVPINDTSTAYFTVLHQPPHTHTHTHTHTNVGGPHAYSPFSLERGYFWPFVSGRFSQEKPENGVFLTNLPRYWGIFQKLPEKIRKNGYYMIYTYLFPELSIASRKKGVGPLLYCISVLGLPPPEGNM